MKTMLDKCAVAGDITQAIDRRGAWSCAVTVIGGTENTAVKLQSADSADGEFTDFKTLISADEAEADQYKGFVLDLSGAGNFIKIVGATMATCVLGDCDHDVKTVAIKAGEIPSGADLEDNKTATIDVSTYTEPVEIEPTEGKDGMKKATVTLSNIPSGAQTFGYAWECEHRLAPFGNKIYTSFDTPPSSFSGKSYFYFEFDHLADRDNFKSLGFNMDDYNIIASIDGFSVSQKDVEEAPTYTYRRVSSDDITDSDIWNTIE